METGEGKIREKYVQVASWDYCFWDMERKEKVLRYRARAVALGRYLIKEGRTDEVSIRRLKGITASAAEDARSLLSRHGGNVGEVSRHVGGALLALRRRKGGRAWTSWQKKVFRSGKNGSGPAAGMSLSTIGE